MSNRQEKIEAFGRLLDVLNVLRAECPWDKKQTENSLPVKCSFPMRSYAFPHDKDRLISKIKKLIEQLKSING